MTNGTCFVAAVHGSQRATLLVKAPEYKRNAPCWTATPATLSPTATMNDTLYCPVPHTYVVAQLDIQATVQNLDAEAQEASQTIIPAKCLLYFYNVSPAIATRWLKPAALTRSSGS